MVKSIISVLISLALIFGFAAYESNFVMRQFDEFSTVLDTLYEKVENQTANKQDVLAAQQNWVDKKKVLHIFIPHNEIKEVDLWLAETISLVGYEKYEDALSKLDVLKELCEQIPTTFRLHISNIL